MNDEFYMQRCYELAVKAAGNVSPNPMVGAVLVHDNIIIGEGWHKKSGEAHAEVNCIASVKKEDRYFIEKSILYVSLEPCAHFGKTPPCADLIIKHKIKKIVIGCLDPFTKVNGKGIEKLKAAGVEVNLTSIEMEAKGREINKRFFTYHTQQRPYIILKWAQSRNGKIATSSNSLEAQILDSENSTGLSNKRIFALADLKKPLSTGKEPRLLISNQYTNILVHQWRSEEAAILIGTNTALFDNPELTTRLWPGNSPVRLIMDSNLKLPPTLKVFNQPVPTIIFNTLKQEEKGNLLYYQLKEDVNLVPQIMKALYQMKIKSVLVEGGRNLLQSFIDMELWDEARILTNFELQVTNGLSAPVLKDNIMVLDQQLLSDKIEIYKHHTKD
ncbi:MAG: bifunctional diaminohydroxyphosphoribosylaminopyrimidine deaminase/5-amino-6-(5-phosphoribosylamino)uracil reductase RibD [Chitinophagaceae bacterium]